MTVCALTILVVVPVLSLADGSFVPGASDRSAVLQQSAPPPVLVSPALVPAKKKPLEKLFTPVAPPRVAPAPQNSSPAGTPRVICGTQVIPGNPAADRKFVAPMPETDVTFTLRTVRPPVCRP
jgi:hypothetical protein